MEIPSGIKCGWLGNPRTSHGALVRGKIVELWDFQQATVHCRRVHVFGCVFSITLWLFNIAMENPL